jgi:hypothetical protein
MFFFFSQGEPRFKFDESNPFITSPEEGEEASVAYRYRKWDLDNGIILVARCEHDAVLIPPAADLQFLTIKALNEWDSKVSESTFFCSLFYLHIQQYFIDTACLGLLKIFFSPFLVC